MCIEWGKAPLEQVRAFLMFCNGEGAFVVLEYAQRKRTWGFRSINYILQSSTQILSMRSDGQIERNNVILLGTYIDFPCNKIDQL